MFKVRRHVLEPAPAFEVTVCVNRQLNQVVHISLFRVRPDYTGSLARDLLDDGMGTRNVRRDRT